MQRAVVLGMVLGCLATAPVAAQCDLAVTAAYPTDREQRRSPRAGDDFRLVVEFTAEGAPERPFRIRFEMANRSYTLYDIRAGEGFDFRYWAQFDLPLDGPIPYRVVLDPDDVAGDANRANNVVEGTFQPEYPREAIAPYDWRTLEAWQSATVRFAAGAAVHDLRACFGVPVHSAYQRVVETEGPAGSATVTAAPHQRPVYEWRGALGDDGTATVERRFTVESASVRSNPTVLHQVPWSAYDNLPPEVAAWQRPERWAPSDAPEIRQFVDDVLPDDYRAILSPYDAARTLHMAVMRFMDYQSSEHPVWDALQSLEARRGNCGNTATLLATLVRAVGLPTRVISGWGEETTSAGHSWTEIYFPGHGWMPADPTWARSEDPEGRYAYYFGEMPHLNQFCAVTTGIEHHTAHWSIDGLITPFVWQGGATAQETVLRTRLGPSRRRDG